MRLEDKVAVITGAASGIGRATALLFAEKGWFVGAYDIDEVGLESLAAELGEGGLVETLDVTQREDYRSALERFGQCSGGRLDLLFNSR